MSYAADTLQRSTILRQQQRIEEQAAEIERLRDRNEALFTLVLQRDRQLRSIRAELMAVRGVLGEELR